MLLKGLCYTAFAIIIALVGGPELFGAGAQATNRLKNYPLLRSMTFTSRLIASTRDSSSR
jgi:hypothetical protein